MSRLLLRPISYRHVVFPDPPEVNRPINFTPIPPQLEADDAPELSSDEYAATAWLLEQAGLKADDYRRETLRRRIPACLRAMRVETMLDACAEVERNPELLEVALNALVIGVTCFFRDPPVFAAIHERVIPELLSSPPRPSGLRVWSAGCSDGSELYSVAMLLAEHGAAGNSTLLGTDCRPLALAQARDACYDTHAVMNVPASLFGKYFHFDDGGWRVNPALRSAARWRGGEVLRTCEPSGWDLILCRNLAIYMQAASAQRLWRRLEHLLQPGGILVLGKAERPVGTTGMRFLAPCIYRRDRS